MSIYQHYNHLEFGLKGANFQYFSTAFCGSIHAKIMSCQLCHISNNISKYYFGY